VIYSIYEQPVHQVPQQLKSPSNSLDYASAQPRETKLFALQVNGVGFLQALRMKTITISRLDILGYTKQAFSISSLISFPNAISRIVIPGGCSHILRPLKILLNIFSSPVQ